MYMCIQPSRCPHSNILQCYLSVNLNKTRGKLPSSFATLGNLPGRNLRVVARCPGSWPRAQHLPLELRAQYCSHTHGPPRGSVPLESPVTSVQNVLHWEDSRCVLSSALEDFLGFSPGVISCSVIASLGIFSGCGKMFV